MGKSYAAQIQAWQARAQFAPKIEWVGEMILQDVRRIVALDGDIKAIEQQTAATAAHSELAQLVDSIPGFGKTTMAEIAGEVGTLARFKSEPGLALYMGMTALDNSSSKKNSTKTPRQINIRIKPAMMVAVARYMECVPLSRIYYDKKRAARGIIKRSVLWGAIWYVSFCRW